MWCFAIENGNGNLLPVMYVKGGSLVILPCIIGFGVPKMIWPLLILLIFVLKFCSLFPVIYIIKAFFFWAVQFVVAVSLHFTLLKFTAS